MSVNKIMPESSRKRFAVTGAGGFIGSRLVAFLLESGHDVTAVVRHELPGKACKDDKAVLRIADVRDPAKLDEAFAGMDGVFHCAALFNHPDSSWDDYRAVNVQGTINVLSAANRQGISRVVHCSTVGVATEASPPPYTEETPYSPQANDKYEVSKCEGEQAALKYAAEHNVSVAVIRPAQVYGPGDVSKVKFYKMVRKGIIVSPGRTRKHLIYIDDLCKAFELAMLSPVADGEVFLIAGEQATELHELISIAAGKLAVKRPTIQLPAFPVTIACTLIESCSNLVGIRPLVHRRSMDFFTRSVECDSSKASKILGFRSQTSVAEGVGRAVDWLQREGHL